LEKHESKCLERPIQCSYRCGKAIKFKDIESHNLECPMYPVKCDFCEEMTENKNLKAHIDNKCPELPTKCPIEGCNEKITKRKYLKVHVEQKYGEHLLLMCNLVSQLKETIEEQEQTITTLQQLQRVHIKSINYNNQEEEFIFKISNFNIDQTVGKFIKSKTFTARYYKFHLRFYESGLDEEDKNNISIFLYIENSEYDSVLVYPFPFQYTISLLDQTTKNRYSRCMDSINEKPDSKTLFPNSYGYGFGDFISKDEFLKGCYNSNGEVLVFITIYYTKKLLFK